MNRQNIEMYKMLTRVADFAANTVGMLPKTSPGSEVQTALSTAVRELAELSSARISAESVLRTAGKERARARETLKGLLAQANRTARALQSEAFRATVKTSDQTLIAFGRAFAADIEPVKKDFLTYGISPEDVATAVTTLERSILDYSAGKAKQAAAIREFNEKLESALGIMRRFEALVENFLSGNSAAMAAWTVARTVNRVMPRKRAQKPANVIEPTPPVKAA